MRVGILALQGAFAEHRRMAESLGASCFEIRSKADLLAGGGPDGIILPGGESTVQGRLMAELGITPVLREMLRDGLPALGTCAGLILLAEKIENEPGPYLGVLPVTVRRNAFGRQADSFNATGDCGAIKNFRMVFIRAPVITAAGPGTEIIARAGGAIAGARRGAVTGIAFHPELGGDPRIHAEFLKMC